jgi:hypothetical protein
MVSNVFTVGDNAVTIYSADPAFDFEQRVYEGLYNADMDPFGSPLSSLSPSPSTSRSTSPEPTALSDQPSMPLTH